VELWNIFVVGNDKTYILCSIKDPFISIPNSGDLINNQASGLIPADLERFLDTIWDRTLVGRQLQFYITWNGRLYFINTFPFFNGKKDVIGAILFMRAFETMPETKYALSEGFVIPPRRSTEEVFAKK
jgi:sensor histidine kinase regulating citrate/malate metabolism